jgi:hypothetical protein
VVWGRCDEWGKGRHAVLGRSATGVVLARSTGRALAWGDGSRRSERQRLGERAFGVASCGGGVNCLY